MQLPPTKPSFFWHFRPGRKIVVIVQSEIIADRIVRWLINASDDFDLRITNTIHDKLHEREQQVLTFAAMERPLTTCAVLIAYPLTIVHGSNLEADVMLWVGDRPHHTDPAFSVYLQAMARGNRPWGQPAKYYYTLLEYVDEYLRGAIIGKGARDRAAAAKDEAL